MYALKKNEKQKKNKDTDKKICKTNEKILKERNWDK